MWRGEFRGGPRRWRHVFLKNTTFANRWRLVGYTTKPNTVSDVVSPPLPLLGALCHPEYDFCEQSVRGRTYSIPHPKRAPPTLPPNSKEFVPHCATHPRISPPRCWPSSTHQMPPSSQTSQSPDGSHRMLGPPWNATQRSFCDTCSTDLLNQRVPLFS